jgi:dihydrodipicolinate synthase/N-acetylneuraminate lyase
LRLQGVFSVLPTPFTGGGNVNVESLRRVVDLFISAGVNGLTALGVTGEVARLSESERDLVLGTVVDHVKAVVKLFRSGDQKRAADSFYRYVPLMRFEFQEAIGMAIRKEVLRRRGHRCNPPGGWRHDSKPDMSNCRPEKASGKTPGGASRAQFAFLRGTTCMES